MTVPEGLRGTLLADPPSTPASRRRWLAARRNVLGASEVAVVLGLSPWQSPLDLWLEKTDPSYESTPSEIMLWGLRLERPVADEFRVRHAKRLGVRVEPSPGLLAHEEHPWLAATPDRVLTKAGKAHGLLEIKTQGEYSSREWRRNGSPLYYLTQCQAQMAVTGMPYTYLVPLFGGRHMPEPVLVERDDVVIGQILELCGAWWTEHVIARVPPEPRVDDLPILDDVWPGGAGSIELPANMWSLAMERRRQAAVQRAAKARIAEIDLELKAAMRDADVGLVGGQRIAKWTRYEVAKFDEAKFREEQPDLYAQYRRKVPSQRFTVNPGNTEDEDDDG